MHQSTEYKITWIAHPNPVYQRLWKGYKFPRPFFAVIIWPNWELYGEFVCMICYFGQSATIKLTHVFMVASWWVAIDFDSQYKVLWNETRAHPWGTYSWEKKEFRSRICIIIPTPYYIRLKHVGVYLEDYCMYTVLQ